MFLEKPFQVSPEGWSRDPIHATSSSSECINGEFPCDVRYRFTGCVPGMPGADMLLGTRDACPNSEHCERQKRHVRYRSACICAMVTCSDGRECKRGCKKLPRCVGYVLRTDVDGEADGCKKASDPQLLAGEHVVLRQLCLGVGVARALLKSLQPKPGAARMLRVGTWCCPGHPRQEPCVVPFAKTRSTSPRSARSQGLKSQLAEKVAELFLLSAQSVSVINRKLGKKRVQNK